MILLMLVPFRFVCLCIFLEERQTSCRPNQRHFTIHSVTKQVKTEFNNTAHISVSSLNMHGVGSRQ